MKKYFKVLAIFVFAFLLCACSNTKDNSNNDTEEKTLSCSINTSDEANGYTLESTYKVFYTGNIVNKAETIEKVTSDSEEVLSYFEETLKTTYDKMNETYGGYTFSVNNDGQKVISSVTVDYSKLDMEKLMNDDSSIKPALDDNNKLTIKGIKSIYESLGATCEK